MGHPEEHGLRSKGLEDYQWSGARQRAWTPQGDREGIMRKENTRAKERGGLQSRGLWMRQLLVIAGEKPQ